MILVCPKCSASNRLPKVGTVPGVPMQRTRCGKCKHEFTPRELMKAKPEPKPERPTIEDVFKLKTQGEITLEGIFDDLDDLPEAGACDFLSDPEDPNFCLVCGLHKEDHKK